MVFTIRNLCVACIEGDIQTVRDIVTSKEVDINDRYFTGSTPLMLAVNKPAEIVRFLLTQPELRLDKRDSVGGGTVLHSACVHNKNIAVVKLFCQDRRCTPSFVNIKNDEGWTALMVAVYWGELEIVKEMEKVEGIDFDTKNNDDKTLIEMARMHNGYCTSSILENKTAVLEYLRSRKKNTLKGMAANRVAKHIENKEDIDVLVDAQHIPKSLRPLVADFFEELDPIYSLDYIDIGNLEDPMYSLD